MLTVKGALKDILNKGAEVGSFEIFFSALKTAGLAGKLGRSGPFTLFLPTDDAFARLEKTTLQDWHEAKGKSELKAILTYHMVDEKLPASELIKSSSVKTVEGTGLTVRFKNNRIHINNATVLQADIECENGIVHVLDTVVIPR